MNVTVNRANMELFWRYIAERHTIYKKRKLQNAAPPWTNDPILQKFKFTNVFRNLDPGTRFVIEKIIPTSNNPEDIIFNIIIYRLYNKIETFEYVGYQRVLEFDRKQFENRLRDLKRSGMNIFTNAFIVSGYSFIKTDLDKIGKTCTIIENISKEIPRLSTEILNKKNSEFTFNCLCNLTGIGEFLAYQMSVDLGYWNKEIFDESNFVVAGPGCRNGINRIFTNRGSMSYEECINYLVSIQKEEFEKLGISLDILFDDRVEKRLNLMAIENCLCEFSKYCKALYEEGRPRNKFIVK